MDMIKLVKTVRKIRKFKRIMTELNQIIPYIKGNTNVDIIKSAIGVIVKLQYRMEKDIETKCDECQSLVVVGKCTGCKKDWLK